MEDTDIMMNYKACVKHSVKRVLLFNIYGKSFRCQCFVTIRKLSDMGKSLGQGRSSFWSVCKLASCFYSIVYRCNNVIDKRNTLLLKSFHNII